ncbi:putative FBD-associated F-box protein At1g78730 [Chenopodium quinoa]|uniref:putative FBD-associated F-box protein At1g78730 n=1 Tax=Chenopodium quinoa TaxID=63459 RepID=UPI000B795A33|nr:putative FBD-associated F-box protein At1g78730 [Chenopodium quinoa]
MYQNQYHGFDKFAAEMWRISYSLRLENKYQSMVKRPRVYIDAPKLANLEIHDCNSIYYFLRNPTALVKAHIDLKDNAKLWQYLDEEGNGSLEGAQKEYLRQMANFVRGLSSASNLKLKLKSPTNIFRYGSFVNLPIFSNLTRLETKGTMDLLRSLHCFPNLEHLVVCLWSEDLQPLETLGFLME